MMSSRKVSHILEFVKYYFSLIYNVPESAMILTSLIRISSGILHDCYSQTSGINGESYRG